MTDQGDLSPGTTPAPQSTSATWASDRKTEQASRHQPPPARQSMEPSPNAARSNPPAGLLDEATRYRLNAEARRAAARGDGTGDHQPPPDPAAGDTPRADQVSAEEIRRLLANDAAERSRKLTLPQRPEDLELKLPADFVTPPGIEFRLDENNPMLAPAKAFALKHGLTKEAWSELLGLSGMSAVAAAVQRKSFVDGEVAKLGVNGTPRVTAITDFQKSYFGDPEMVKALLPTTALAVQGWETLIRERQTQGSGVYPGGNREPPPAKTEIPNYENMSFAERRAAQSRLR